MKKILFAIIASLSLTTLPISAKDINESESKLIELQFQDFVYTTPEINENNSIVIYEKNNNVESYKVYSKETGLLTDEIQVSLDSNNDGISLASDGVRDSIFTRYKNVYGGDKLVVRLRCDISVSLYSSGSFRSFNGINYGKVSIDSRATPMYISGSDSAYVHSHTNSFPTTQLDYSYTVTVVTSGKIQVSAGTMISAGFSQNTYYYKTINETGTIKLYN